MAGAGPEDRAEAPRRSRIAAVRRRSPRPDRPPDTARGAARDGARDRRGDPRQRPDRPVLRRRAPGAAAPGGVPRLGRAGGGRGAAPRAPRRSAARRWAPTRSPARCSPPADDLKAFFVRKERKEHGLQRWIEGPPIEPGERALVVEDVVTSGGSLVSGDRAAARGGRRAGRRAGGAGPARRRPRGDRGARSATDFPTSPCFTIDDVYPDRPDR